MSTMTARVGPEGQVTVPAFILEKLGVRPGHLLRFEEEAGFVRIRPNVDREAAYALLGSKKKEMEGLTSAEWIELFRGPVELAPKSDDPRG